MNNGENEARQMYMSQEELIATGLANANIATGLANANKETDPAIRDKMLKDITQYQDQITRHKPSNDTIGYMPVRETPKVIPPDNTGAAEDDIRKKISGMGDKDDDITVSHPAGQWDVAEIRKKLKKQEAQKAPTGQFPIQKDDDITVSHPAGQWDVAEIRKKLKKQEAQKAPTGQFATPTTEISPSTTPPGLVDKTKKYLKDLFGIK